MSADPSASTCFFFAYGECVSEGRCAFSHVIEDDQFKSTSNYPVEDASTAVPLEFQRENNRPSHIACRFWKKGVCNKGKLCKFVHPVPLRRNSWQSVASTNSRASSDYSIGEPNDDPRNEDDEARSVRSELSQDKDRRLSASNDAEPNVTVESTMQPFEPEDAEQVQDVQVQDQAAPAADHLIEECEDLTQPQLPTEQGDTSLDTITPDNYVPADELGSETQGEGRENQLDSMPAFVADSIESDHPEAVESIQGARESEPSIGCSETLDLHWTEYADPHANPFIAFCKFFAKGRCKNGASCTYRHALTVQEFFLLFRVEPLMWSPQVSVPVPDSEENDQEVASVQPPLQPPLQQAVQPSIQTSLSLGACAFYPLGKCRNGDKCPYAHIDAPDAELGYNEQGTDELSETNSHEPNDWKTKRPPCRYFTNYGSCRRGDDCEFSHEKDDNYSWDNGSQAWNQDEPAASGSKGAEEYASASDWNTEYKSDENKESNELTTNGREDIGEQASIDWRDQTEPRRGDDRWGNEWVRFGANTTKREEYNEGSRIGNRSRPGDSWRKVCRDYLRGSCHRSGCRFAHETDDTAHHDWNKDDWVTRNPLPEASSNDEWMWGNETNDTAMGGNEWDAPSTSRQGRQEDRSDQRVCFAYLRGQCSRTRCRFAHESKSNQQDSHFSWNTDEQANTRDSSQHRNDDAWHEQPSEPNADSWHQTDHGSSFASSGRGRETCLYFGQGFCQKGDSCPFLHVQSDGITSGENSDQEIEDNGSAHDEDMTTERSMFNCTVVFGAGGNVQYALTATDPNCIIVKNLPFHVSRRELEKLPINGLRTVHIDKLTEPVKAIIEFDTKQQTLSALKVLNNYEFGGSTLLAQPYTDQALDPNRAVINCEVMVTWPTPYRIAWARYGTVTLAKEDAARLDGRIVDGRKIKASYLPAKKGQSTMFTVQINNLPAEDTDVSIKQRCTECQYVNVTAPTYVSSPVEPIREILEKKWGVLTAFEVLDLPSSEEMTAFARFETPEAARAAVGKLKVDFLGSAGILKVQGTHHSQFDVQREQFRYIEGDLEKYREIYNGQCFILVASSDHNVCVHIAAAWTEAIAFAKLLASLNTLIYGDILKQDGVVVWDDYFDSTSSTKVIEAVNAENSRDYNVLLVPDRRERRIHILGEQSNRARAKESILKVLKKVRMGWNEVPLDRFFVRWYLEQGRELLQSEPDVGKNKVTLDLVDSNLIVKGDSKVLNKVKEIISNAVTIRRDSLDKDSANICHICLGKAISPIILQCRHGYCRECLSTLLASAVENIRTTLKCIAEVKAGFRCNQDIPYLVMRDLLPLADEERLLRAHFLSFVRSNMEGLFFCPSLHCEAVHRCDDIGVNLRCSTCMMEICSSCQTKYHAGVTCAQWQETISA